ncbi:MAG TPA: hypothetical protein VFZ02_10170, partial [Ktedonobacteraceae bacterium]
AHVSAPISHALSGSIHACAPPIPPPVPGSPLPTPAIRGRLLINEVLSLPQSRWNCSEQDNTFSINNDSWVELYNPQSQPSNLYAAHASFDTGPNTLPSYLPLGAVIAPHGYLVLFPSVFSGTLIIKANLRLIIAGVTIDQVNIPSLPIDQSYARIPDGSNFWQITNTPTIDASNKASQLSPQGSPTASSPNQGPASSGYSTPTTLPVAGMQPAWSNLQFPTRVTATNADVNSTPTRLTTSPTLTVPVNDGWDIHRRILLTALMVALALMLFWCWRLFSTP